MPTLILLDVSLSMSRPVNMQECSEEYQRRHLAIHGINTLLDYMAANCKLEFTSLIVFSYLWEQLVPFTRDPDQIKNALNKVEAYSKTCIETALNGVNSVILEEWSIFTPCQVILITDGCSGVGPGSLSHSLQKYQKRESSKNGNEKSNFPLPFSVPCKLNVMCIAPASDTNLQISLSLFQKLIDINGHGGDIYIPEGALSIKSVQQMFQKFAGDVFSPFVVSLNCGHLKCSVQLYPPPGPQHKIRDFENINVDIGSTLEICGFLDIADVASPPIISRHLVLPTAKEKPKEEPSTENVNNKDSKDGDEDAVSSNADESGKATAAASALEGGKAPSFSVLLHGSLKVEGMVALTQVGDNWYGILYSWADSKKKSNLMLSLFEPGENSLSWLGNFKYLASIYEFGDESPYGSDDTKSPFPIRPTEKRSYAQSCVVWIKTSGLQADLQKVLRHARKLPDKQQQFYKELNRLRRAALSFGFLELLDAMALMLERECTLLPGTAHPDAALQLSHAANSLRSEMAKDVSQTIVPLRTNFSSDD